jgi:hypothetical protein
MQIGTTPSGSDRALPHPPKTFDRGEVMATMSREEMPAQRPMLESRCELMSALETAALNDHHDRWLGCPQGRHPWVHILAQLLGIKEHALLDKDLWGCKRPLSLVAYDRKAVILHVPIWSKH